MIYIITRQPMPNGMAGSNRIKCYARALINAGASCRILVFSRDGFSTNSEGMIDSVPFRYVCGFKKRWPGRLGSLQTVFMMFGLYFFLLFKLKKGDVVLEYARESYRFLYRLIEVTHYKRAMFVSELCEVPGLGFQTKEAIREKEYITTKLFPRYDGIISISESLVKYAKEHASKRCKVIKIPVLVDAEEFMALGERPILEPYIFYSGSFDDQKDGTTGMFEAFRQVAREYDKPLKIVCTGNKEDAFKTEYLRDAISDETLSKRLVFTGYLTHDQIINYLLYCELLVSARYSNEQTQNGFSTKLAEYAASGKPLVLTPVGEAANWFHDGEDCVMIPERDSRSLATAIIRLLNDKDEKERLGENIRKTCRNSFDYRAWSNPLKDFINEVINNGN